MEKIIDPVDSGLIKSELTPDRKLCDANRGGTELYIVNAHNSPNTMREIGRLREESFRPEGGCSGLSCDIDEYDTMDVPYEQLLVWDPENEVILGGYRFITGDRMSFGENGQPRLASAHMFRFSDEFIRDYLPRTIELGRSFVAPAYQSSVCGAKNLYVLDNLWDGLSYIILANPTMKYFFGKMTLHPTYDHLAMDLIYYFLEKHFNKRTDLVSAYEPQPYETDSRALGLILSKDDFKEDYFLLKSSLKKLGMHIPPLVNSYIHLTPTMKVFGAALNHHFCEASEFAILVDFEEVDEEKKQRHIVNFIKER